MTDVSVIMGVYNGAKHLESAIDSILNQTCKDIEFIICDDGSTDESLALIRKKAKIDPRIKILTNKSNQGLAYSLNKCIKFSNGKYLVRMDSDDLSKENRIERLVYHISKDAEYAVIGSTMILFNDQRNWGQTSAIEYPDKLDIFKGPAVSHATVIMKKSIIEKVGAYNPDMDQYRIEDYDLWCRLAESNYKIKNIDEALYLCRWDHKDYYKRRKLKHLLGLAKHKFYWGKRFDFGIKGYTHAQLVLLKGLTPSFIKKIYHKHKLKVKN